MSELKERDPERQEVADLYALWWSRHSHVPVAAANLDPDLKNLINPQGRAREIAPELTGHGLPLSKCEAYNRVYDQFYRSR